MKAIILVGGFGTRLRQVLPDVPKPMAPVADNKPFLAYLLNYLKSQGVSEIIFSVHYLREQIEQYFHSSYAGMQVLYAVEDEPLGTGGAMVNALSMIKTSEPVLVLNGDTFVNVNYQAMYQQHLQQHSSLTMALRSVNDCSRYGRVMIEDNRVIAFKEKGDAAPGYINAGVYILNPTLFSSYSMPDVFSFEQDFLFPYLNTIAPQSFIANDYFIDIGIPEDYARAKMELPKLAL